MSDESVRLVVLFGDREEQWRGVKRLPALETAPADHSGFGVLEADADRDVAVEKDDLWKLVDAGVAEARLGLDDQGIPIESRDDVLRAQAEQQVVIDGRLIDDLDAGKECANESVDPVADSGVLAALAKTGVGGLEIFLCVIDAGLREKIADLRHVDQATHVRQRPAIPIFRHRGD